MKFLKIILDLLKKYYKALFIYIVTIVVIVFIAVFIFDNIIMPSYVRLGDEYPIPDLVGFNIEEAQRILEHDGFVLSDEITEKIDYQSKPGIILEHFPKQGSICKKGRKVYITISKGGLPVIVPNLIGMSPQDAKYNIAESKLYLDSILYEFSLDFPEGVVMGQSMIVNDSVSIGDSLFIVVSLGKHPSEYIIPDVVEMNLDEAAEVISKSGFKISEIVYYKDEDLLPGTVMDQKPPKDEIVYEGTQIRLLVSTLLDADSLNQMIQDGKFKDEQDSTKVEEESNSY